MDPDRDTPDRPAATLTTARLGGSGRGPAVVAAMIAAFVVVALLKPWPGPGAPRPTPQLPARTAPTAAASVDPLAQLRLHCQEPLGWRVFSQERWLAMTVRSWRSLQPAYGATGPLDPAIPVVPIVATLDGLGYCSPWTDDQRPPDGATVDGWQIVDPISRPDGRTSGAAVAAVVPLRPLTPGWSTVLGALYAPPVGASGATGGGGTGWATGRFVFAVRAPGYQRWWAVDLESPSGEQPAGQASGQPAVSSPSVSP
jgi:hypothetical protein